MNVEEIRSYCLSFPDATENLQWGDDLCFKIGGKIFAIVALTALPQKLCFKCTPEIFSDLIERKDIAPAPYVGRYKWVLLNRLDALESAELKDLVRWSYEAATAKLPKSNSRTSKASKSAEGKNGVKKKPAQTHRRAKIRPRKT
jgi:predicted DNA-binding protein (MmcQ/YjbR family)